MSQIDLPMDRFSQPNINGISESPTVPSAQSHNPYARLIQREARRREFERRAASKYGLTAGHETHNHLVSPSSSKSHSPNTPSYPIPKPPIPGEKVSHTEIHLCGDPSPKDPRALLPSPKMSLVPPSPVIPKVKKVQAVQPMKISRPALLPDPEVQQQPLLPSPKKTALLPSPTSADDLHKQKSLLPPPKGLLPEPKGLLPNPMGLLPNPTADLFHVAKGSLDEDDWNIISNPTAPITKRKYHGNGGYDSTNHRKRSRNRETKSEHSKRHPPIDQENPDDIGGGGPSNDHEKGKSHAVCHTILRTAQGHQWITAWRLPVFL